MGVFYSAAQPYVLDELERRKNKGYIESRRQLGIYVTIKAPETEGYLSSLDNTSIASRYSKSTGRPTPSLTTLKVEMSGEYGSLKKAYATVKCFDKKSFEEFEQAFLIPGTEIEIMYGRSGISGKANNGIFEGVVYDYSFKMNPQLGYDCEIKAVAKGSMVTEMNVNSKLEDTGREFTSNFDGFNSTSTVVNICDVFDYDVQKKMDDQEDLDEDEGYSYSGYSNAHMAGTDCPNAAPDPIQDGMVGGNIIFCSIGYIVNKLINDDLLTKNAEAENTTKKRKIKFICNDKVTIGKEYSHLFSANPMKVLISGKQRNEKYGGDGGGTFGACKWWGKQFDLPKVLDGSGTAKLANILIGRDTLRKIAGAGGTTGEGGGSKTSINKFLQGLFKEIYTLSGGAWDLTTTSMTFEQCQDYGVKFDKNAMYIIDRNYAKGSGAEKIHLNALNASSFDNSTRNVAITGKVPKDMAAAAFVGGTGTASGKKGAVTAGILAGNLLKKVGLFKGWMDSIAAFSDERKIKKSLTENRELIHDNGYSEEEITAAQTNLKAYIEGGQTAAEKAEWRKDMYPLNLSATLDGIEGIQFGNVCQSDLVPSRYYTGTPKICFTITKVIHNIAGNDWTTDLETICRMEP